MMRSLIACIVLVVVFPVYSAEVINSVVMTPSFTGSQRVIVQEGAEICGNPIRPALAFGDEEDSPTLEIYGGAIYGDVVFGTDFASVVIKGGEIRALDRVSSSLFQFGNASVDLDIFGTNFTNVEKENFTGTILCTLADGTFLSMDYAGEFLNIRFHDVSSNSYEGVEVCSGDAAFADRVTSFQPGSGFDQIVPNLQDPLEALGIPNFVGAPNDADVTGAVSLGNGGTIIVEFCNNVLQGDGSNNPDLVVYEAGAITEQSQVSISKDGTIWIPLGTIGGGVSTIDIDASGIDLDEIFRFVRITDDPAQGGGLPTSVGAEIDAVATLSGRTVEVKPQPEIAVTRDPLGFQLVDISVETFIGSDYQLETAEANFQWDSLGEPFQGSGVPMTQMQQSSDFLRFYRIRDVTLESLSE